MFFSVTGSVQDNFSASYQLGPFVINTDQGWSTHSTDSFDVVYKGYADEHRLEDIVEHIAKQATPEYFGNFCAVVYDRDSQVLRIQTDRLRCFPIYFTNKSCVTNLVPQAQTAWTDSLISIDREWEITESKFDLIGTIDTTPLTTEQVIEQIHDRLTTKTENFLRHNRLPVRAFLSGGVDSLLVYSYLQKATSDYELVNYSLIQYDKFWLKNSGDILRHWAYSQIHHWVEPCVLTSGAPGDEFTLRSPTTVDMFLKYHGQHMQTLLQQGSWLHSEYFGQAEHQDIFSRQTIDHGMSAEQFHRHLCNIVVNDWQHWHIGNTLTWTPLRDLEIFKLLLRLPVSEAIPQIMNSDISRALIEKNQPGMTSLISHSKNTGNCMSNLCDLLLQSS